MRIPTLRGLIARRVLVNYRLDPRVVAAVLPAPFRPVVVNGFAVGGICLIRLQHVRPAGLPACIGVGSENAAHRFAVEWTGARGEKRSGVYIPRRDTGSRLNAWAGGRLFPGDHHHARFDVSDDERSLRIAMTSDDRETRVSLNARVVDRGDDQALRIMSRCFSSLETASQFFETGSLGYSATRETGRFDGIELRCRTWDMQALVVDHVESSYFDNSAIFAPGSATFDCALLMRGIDHDWEGREPLCCTHF